MTSVEQRIEGRVANPDGDDELPMLADVEHGERDGQADTQEGQQDISWRSKTRFALHPGEQRQDD